MVVPEEQGISPPSMVLIEDEKWLRSIFQMVPRGVYHTNVNQPGSAKKKRRVRSETGKKKANKKKKEKMRLNSATESNASKRKGDLSQKDLKKKLREKIEAMRAQRKADDVESAALRANRKRKREDIKKLKQNDRQKTAKRARPEKKDANDDKAQDSTEKPSTAESATNRGENDNTGQKETAIVALETTRLSGFEGDDKMNKKRRKLGETKLKVLQKKLEEASEEQQLKEKVIHNDKKTTKDNAVDPAEKETALVVQKREFEKALKRTKGERVKDSVQKLRKSIRKEKRKTIKSREDWGSRVKSVENDINARQEKRQKNLRERREARKPRTTSIRSSKKVKHKKKK